MLPEECLTDRRRRRRWTVLFVVLFVSGAVAPWAAFLHERERATVREDAIAASVAATEQRVIQRTVDRIADVARLERETACSADEDVRAAARVLILSRGLALPRQFEPRDCGSIADEYAERLRSAGPLGP